VIVHVMGMRGSHGAGTGVLTATSDVRIQLAAALFRKRMRRENALPARRDEPGRVSGEKTEVI
jgi:hypothetical protein